MLRILLFMFLSNILLSQTSEWKYLQNSFEIRNIAVDNSNIYLGFDNKLMLIKKSNKSIISYDRFNSELISDKINKIAIDANKTVWIATDNGLAELKSNNLQVHFPSMYVSAGDKINDIFITQNDEMYLSTDIGVVKYEEGTFKKVFHPELEKSINQIIIQDSILYFSRKIVSPDFAYTFVGKINLITNEFQSVKNWMTEVNLYQYDSLLLHISYKNAYIVNESSFKNYFSSNMLKSRLNDVTTDSKNNLWIALDSNLMQRTYEGKFSYHLDSANLNFNLIEYDEMKGTFLLSGSEHGALSKYNELYEYDPKSDEITSFNIKNYDEEYISNYAKEIVKIDDFRMLVSYDKGVSLFETIDKREDHFSFIDNHYNISKKLNMARLFTYGGNGTIFFNLKEENYNNIYETDWNTYKKIIRFESSQILDIAKVQNDKIWVCDIYRGVYEVRDSVLARIHDDLELPLENTVNHLTVGTDDEIWMISNHSNNVIKYSNDGVTVFYNSIDALDIVEVTSLNWSDKLHLLAGTKNGKLIQFDGENTVVLDSYYDDLPYEYITDIEIDKNGNAWIATNGGGFVFYDGVDIEVFTDENSGLLSNRINDMEFDYTGKIWFATDFGVCITDPDYLITGVKTGEVAQKFDISVIPNPVNDICNIHLPRYISDSYTISLYDITGNRLFSTDYNQKAGINLDMSQYSSGTYYLIIQDENSISSKKIMVSR